MALTLEELQTMVRQGGLKFYVDPDRPRLMFGITGPHGTYQCVISLEVDGKFLQLRSVRYLFCPPDHPHLTAVLRALGALNYDKRLVKFGWDPSDGEIVVYADLWLMDNKLTQEQWEQMLQNYLAVLDLGYRRLAQVLQTGQDPGEEELGAVVQRLLGDRGLPGPLRELLEELSKKLAAGQLPAEEPEEDEIKSI